MFNVRCVPDIALAGPENSGGRVSFNIEGAMKQHGFLMLSALLMIAPFASHAQSDTPAAGDSAVVAQDNQHRPSDWARARLDEMDAAMAVLERELVTLEAEGRARAERVIADMRADREALMLAIETQLQAGEAGLQELRAGVVARWTAFESSVQTWMETTGAQVAARKAVFAARADAQISAWQDMIAAFEVSAQSVAAERRQKFDAALATLRADADAARESLEAMKQSGEERWTAFAEALEEARAAFEDASHTATEALRRATH